MLADRGESLARPADLRYRNPLSARYEYDADHHQDRAENDAGVDGLDLAKKERAEEDRKQRRSVEQGNDDRQLAAPQGDKVGDLGR